MWNLALFLLLIAVTAVPLTAQVGGTPTTGSGGQTSIQANPSLGSGGGAKGTDVSRPIYISGKVVMDDGSAVLQNITIERVCSGISKTVAYTDSNGRFNFRWGDGNMIVADASDAGSGRYSEFQLRRLRQFSIGRRRQCPGGRSIRQPDDELRSTGQRGGLFLRRNQPVQSPDCRQSRCWLDRPPSHRGRRGIVHQRNVDAWPQEPRRAPTSEAYNPC